MPAQYSGVGVEAAAGREADDDANGLARVKILSERVLAEDKTAMFSSGLRSAIRIKVANRRRGISPIHAEPVKDNSKADA
jgi:hypothetical protein